jgi:MFS transporter, OFA family, oxalate/formate antiporter
MTRAARVGKGAGIGQPSVGAGVGARASAKRWLQLAAGIAGLIMIANLQYGWTLFVNPIDAAHHWGKA